jgi:hypothetical protein
MNFVVREDRSLFIGFALLNVIGYNAENGWHFSHVRKDVRLSLSAHASHWQCALGSAGLLEPLLRAGGAMLMDVLPSLSLGDDSSRRIGECSTKWQRASQFALTGIDQWLLRFSSEGAVESLWLKHHESYQEAGSLLQSVIPRLQSLAAHFSCENDQVAVLLEPNLLDAHGRGYSMSISDQTWLYLGPVKDRLEAETLAAHELLHRWADPAAERVVRSGRLMDPMPRARAQFRIVAESYPELAIWIGETVVRAATAWLVPESIKVTLRNEAEVSTFWEQVGFVGFADAYRYLVDQSGRSLEKLLDQAALLVYERLERW